ncbi:MAG: 5-formyltetrahydrofolate cyclo-ligase [Planctomycetes bacterium]|nr:5-formyltetrahydrofolate cyclo-ligase [Planctomycetota bacterium]
MEKREARKEVARRIESLSPGEREAGSAALVRNVLDLPEFDQGQCVLLFVPMADEVDVTELIRASLRTGKRVCVPTCSTKDHRLIPAELSSLDELAPGAYGIPEPKTVREVAVGDIDFVLVPAAGFDPKGNRLGRGAGYYDRFMSRPEFRAVKCGVGFETQVLDEIPYDDHDLPVDILVTDQRISRFRHPSRTYPG